LKDLGYNSEKPPLNNYRLPSADKVKEEIKDLENVRK
jgi:hypothetical protein